MKHYFDFAAATPMSPAVKKAMESFFSDNFYNPSALYLPAQATKQALNEARSTVAKILGAKASEVIFTAGGTEANNLAVQGIMRQYPNANCVVSAIEHEAVLAPARNSQCKVAMVKPDGRVDVAALIAMIDDKTVLVSVMYANNEIGSIQPLHEIANELKKIREIRRQQGNELPLYFHTDACQAGNYLPLLAHNLGVDMMTLNGGKIYGPKQSGVLFVVSHVKLQPIILGGGQERNLRSGTENVAGAVGFATALEEAQSIRHAESKRLVALREYFIQKLTDSLPEILTNGSREYRLPNNVHLTVPGKDNERLMMELDEKGFMVATGSACSASSNKPSHVLTAIGLSDEAARSSLRVTFGRQTDQPAIDALIAQLVDICS